MPCFCGSKEKPVKSSKEKPKKVKKGKHDTEELPTHVTIAETGAVPASDNLGKTPRSPRNVDSDDTKARISFSEVKDVVVAGEKTTTKSRSTSIAKSEETPTATEPKPARKSKKSKHVDTPDNEKEKEEATTPAVTDSPQKSPEDATKLKSPRSATTTPRKTPHSVHLPLESIFTSTSQPSSAPSSARASVVSSRPLISPRRRVSAMSRAGMESLGRSGSISMHEWSKLQADAKKEATHEKERIVKRKVTLAANINAQLSTLRENHEASMRTSREFKLDDLDDLALDGDEVALAKFKPEEYDEQAVEDAILEQKIMEHLENDVEQAKVAINAIADNSESLDLDDLNALDDALDIDVIDFDGDEEDEQAVLAEHCEQLDSPRSHHSQHSKQPAKSMEHESKNAGSDDETADHLDSTSERKKKKKKSSSRKKLQASASDSQGDSQDEKPSKHRRQTSRGSSQRKKDKGMSTPRTNTSTFDDPSMTEETHTEEPQTSDLELSKSATTPRRGSHKRSQISGEFVMPVVEPVA